MFTILPIKGLATFFFFDGFDNKNINSHNTTNTANAAIKYFVGKIPILTTKNASTADTTAWIPRTKARDVINFITTSYNSGSSVIILVNEKMKTFKVIITQKLHIIFINE